VLVLVLGVRGAAAGNATYDMTRMLSQPHPLARQMGTRWRPALPGAPSPPPVVVTGAPGAAPPAAPPAAGPVDDPGAAPKSSAVWRLEHGNEDRGFLTEPFEPLFDPIFGGSPTDGQLTWAWRLSYTPNGHNPDWFQWLRQYLPWINSEAEARASYSIEQDAITPSAIAKEAGLTVRPHAGHLGFDARVAVIEPLGPRWQRLDQIDLVAGLVGPASGAEAVHDISHDIIGEETDDWDQIESEPFVNINYEYGHRFFLFEPGRAANAEFHPYIGGALGNVLTYGSLGLNLRVGRNLFRDRGALRQRVLLSGENFPDPGDYWAWNFFIGMEGRAIAHTVFLDGNLFQDSVSVDKNTFVYDVQAGIEAGYGGTRFSVMNVFRSREFKGQQFTTEFVRVALSVEY
jgi:hypothetical protein